LLISLAGHLYYGRSLVQFPERLLLPISVMLTVSACGWGYTFVLRRMKCPCSIERSKWMSDFKELLTLLEKFRDDRDWGQFHDSKNLALALSIEAAELNELFLWKKESESEGIDRQRLREELADVFAYAIMLAGRHGLDVSEIVKEKIEKNARKYPVEQAKGSSLKYKELSSDH
jgi:NTP pyrophosphatase (non-canonical NTP hydrolase)